MENRFPLSTVLGVALVALVVGLTCGATFLSGSDMSAEESISGWNILSGDIHFRSMKPEDRIEMIVSYVAEGSDPRPAWPIVTDLLNDAFADIYSEGYVDCQEKCERAMWGN